MSSEATIDTVSGMHATQRVQSQIALFSMNSVSKTTKKERLLRSAVRPFGRWQLCISCLDTNACSPHTACTFALAFGFAVIPFRLQTNGGMQTDIPKSVRARARRTLMPHIYLEFGER